MTNISSKKVFIQIESAAEQQVIDALDSLALASAKNFIDKEHLKNQRKTLKVLQSVASDKENLTGRSEFDNLSRLKALTDSTLASKDFAKRKKIDTRSVETQTQIENERSNKITVADLTGEASPSEYYWERLAEKRRETLEEALSENRHLYERIEGLEEELNTSRQMLEETKNLVEVLTEMLEEKEEGEKSEQEDGEKCDLEEIAEHSVTSDDSSETKNKPESNANKSTNVDL